MSSDTNWAFLVLVSDGVSSMMSDDELVGLARDARDPKAAADRILSYSEELGGEDNATAIVVPLSGWGMIQGPDKTKELREYRLSQAGMFHLRVSPGLCLTIRSQWVVNGSVECRVTSKLLYFIFARQHGRLREDLIRLPKPIDLSRSSTSV